MRLQVSIVSQEPVLFAESIMHNIAYGMPGGTANVSLAQVSHPPSLSPTPLPVCLADSLSTNKLCLLVAAIQINVALLQCGTAY